MSTKKSKPEEIRKNKKASGEYLYFFFTQLYFTRLQVVGAVVLIHPVLGVTIKNKKLMRSIKYGRKVDLFLNNEGYQ
jgi:hypothetical protein